jgi:hypothetical protein
MWMMPWLESLMASAIVATAADGTDEPKLQARVEASAGRLSEDALIAARLLAGNAEGALAECERRLPQVEVEGLSRAYWITEELRIRTLLAIRRHSEARGAVDTALNAVAPTGWQSLAWRLHASRAAALKGVDSDQAEQERLAAVDLLMRIANTFSDTSARSRFLSQRIAKRLLM